MQFFIFVNFINMLLIRISDLNWKYGFYGIAITSAAGLS